MESLSKVHNDSNKMTDMLQFVSLVWLLMAKRVFQSEVFKSEIVLLRTNVRLDLA